MKEREGERHVMYTPWMAAFLSAATRPMPRVSNSRLWIVLGDFLVECFESLEVRAFLGEDLPSHIVCVPGGGSAESGIMEPALGQHSLSLEEVIFEVVNLGVLKAKECTLPCVPLRSLDLGAIGLQSAHARTQPWVREELRKYCLHEGAVGKHPQAPHMELLHMGVVYTLVRHGLVPLDIRRGLTESPSRPPRPYCRLVFLLPVG
jgi:hypothetical protein